MKLSNASFIPLSLWLVIGLSLASCKDKEAPIEPEKMHSIILDLQTAESYNFWIVAQGDLDKKNEDSLAYYYAKVLKKYNINANELNTAMDWYFHHPQKLNIVYHETIDSATVIKNKYERLDRLKPMPENENEDRQPIEAPAMEHNGLGSVKPKRDKAALDKMIKQTEDEDRKKIKKENKEKLKALNKVKNEN
ncbi:MAG TPA: DUF4296 domain-containing protein [Edaphocola sp.]|nr:DUF4296 domain-containing protein [Edaphocola sp.]